MKKPAQDLTVLLPGAVTANSSHKYGGGWRADMLEAARSRIRLLTLLLLFAFVFDPVLHAGLWLATFFFDKPLSYDLSDLLGLDFLSLCAAFASLGLWWMAGNPRISSSALVTTSLVYEIIICFVVTLLSFLRFYIDTGILPHITWVIGIIILFPLVVPAPPKLILMAALASAMTPALALGVLLRLGLVSDSPGYLTVVINPLLAAAFAFLAARVVYGLGREVAAFRELGSYQLEERLGQGGMGEIWKARHRLLARPAAIKLIRPGLAVEGNSLVFEEFLRRFEREAQVIASLRSPHTVTLFDFGVSSDGVFYYVMELLEGLDADELVRRFGSQPAERVIHILRQVCHSLSESESCGVVHRDIKPSNIFLCRYGEDCDFVKVLDFGLAKDLNVALKATENITIKNAIHGTPAFMAPEQARGDAALDIRADIYAVGCVAYWLLTARTVFTAENAIGHIIAQTTEQPVTPSARTSMPVPPELDRIILDCLEKSPERRPQTVRELLERLVKIDDGAWNRERSREWWTRVVD